MTEQDLIDLIYKDIEFQAQRPGATPYVGVLQSDGVVLIDGKVNLGSIAKLILKAIGGSDDHGKSS